MKNRSLQWSVKFDKESRAYLNVIGKSCFPLAPAKTTSSLKTSRFSMASSHTCQGLLCQGNATPHFINNMHQSWVFQKTKGFLFLEWNHHIVDAMVQILIAKRLRAAYPWDRVYKIGEFGEWHSWQPKEHTICQPYAGCWKCVECVSKASILYWRQRSYRCADSW